MNITSLIASIGLASLPLVIAAQFVPVTDILRAVGL